MGYQLHPGLTFARFDTDLIFLDLSRDRYFRPRAPEARAFIQLIDGRADHRDVANLDRFVRCVEGSELPVPVSVVLATGQSGPDPAQSVSAVATLGALAAQVRSGWIARHRPLARIMHDLRQVRVAERGGATRIGGVIAAHARADLLRSAHDRCLAKSIALYIMLRRAGSAAELVFGVAAKPFAAHCWVQVGDKVINGEVAVTRLFMPILVIG
jgi:hypothetical protein